MGISRKDVVAITRTLIAVLLYLAAVVLPYKAHAAEVNPAHRGLPQVLQLSFIPSAR